jgi:hypothetical protein
MAWPVEIRNELLNLAENAPLWRPIDVKLGFAGEPNFRPRTLHHLLAPEISDTDDFVVNDMLLSGCVSELFAAPFAGKSTLTLNLALAVTRGNPFIGLDTRRGRVLYLGHQEWVVGLRRNLRKIGMTPDDDMVIFTGLPPSDDAVAWLSMLVRFFDPTLVIIDTVQSFLRLESWDDYATVSLALDPLIDLARQSGIHILLTHHSIKRMTSISSEASMGSTGFPAAVDTMLVMSLRGNTRYLTTHNRYGAALSAMKIDYEPLTHRVTVASPSDITSSDTIGNDIRDFLANGEATEEKIVAAVSGNSGAIKVRLRALVEEGAVKRSGAGVRGSPYNYSQTVFDEPSRYEDQKDRE